MRGWMDACVDGWVERWMDKSMGGWLDGLTDAGVGGRTGRRTGEQVDWTDRQQTGRRAHGWWLRCVGGGVWVDEQMDGRLD